MPACFPGELRLPLCAVESEGHEQEAEAQEPRDERTPPPHAVDGDAQHEPFGLSARRKSARLMRGLYALGVASVVVIGANLFFIYRTLEERATRASDVALAAIVPTTAPPPRPAPAPSEREAPDDPDTPVEPKKPRDTDAKPSKTKKAQTVEQALSTGCSTSSVDGLSRQIMAEAQCADPRMFAVVPRRKNLVVSGNVLLYLEAPARDQLLKVLDANPKRTLTVNSAFRTVAQQFLLDRWARGGRCGIKLAAHPGESNHETGLAIDVSEPGTWRSSLEEHGFHWMGQIDPVHFDYQGPGAVKREGIDIVAFQRLWNRNHPEDRIPENGAYGEQVESRIKKSPAGGFTQGPICGKTRAAAPKAR